MSRRVVIRYTRDMRRRGGTESTAEPDVPSGSFGELLDAVHGAALASIGMIVDIERSAIFILHAYFPELVGGSGATAAEPRVYVPGARGEVHRYRAAGLVSDELAEAYRRSLTARLEDPSGWVQTPQVIPSPLSGMASLGLVTGEQAEHGSRLHAVAQPMLAGAGLSFGVITANFDQLVDSMMPSPGALHAAPEAIVEAARRRAELRTQLLATGALSYRDLADGRSMSAAATRQWVRRARERNELFTVEHHGETFVPALLLDEDLLPRGELRPVISVLMKAGEDGWGIWAWLALPSPWLDGGVPAEMLRLDPERVVAAAASRASNAA